MPKYQFLPFSVCLTSGSCPPSAFFVELGAEISVVSHRRAGAQQQTIGLPHVIDQAQHVRREGHVLRPSSVRTIKCRSLSLSEITVELESTIAVLHDLLAVSSIRAHSAGIRSESRRFAGHIFPCVP